MGRRILLVLMLAAGLHSHAALGAELSARDHGQFARLSFDWGVPVGHSVNVDLRRVQLGFDRPLDGVDLPVALAGVSEFVSDAIIGGDGRTLILTLTRPMRVSDRVEAGAVVLDLVPGTTVGGQAGVASALFDEAATADVDPAAPLALVPREPSAQAGAIPTTMLQPAAGPPDPVPAAERTAPAAPAANRQEDVRVRTGSHPGYSRIVFDWPARTEYVVEQTGQAVTIVFDAEAGFDFRRAGTSRLIHVGGLRAVEMAQGSAVAIAVAPGAGVEHSTIDSRIVIDISGPPAAAANPTPDQPSDSVSDAGTVAAATVTDASEPEAGQAPLVEPPTDLSLSTPAETAEGEVGSTEPPISTDEPARALADDSEPAVGAPLVLSEHAVRPGDDLRMVRTYAPEGSPIRVPLPPIIPAVRTTPTADPADPEMDPAASAAQIAEVEAAETGGAPQNANEPQNPNVPLPNEASAAQADVDPQAQPDPEIALQVPVSADGAAVVSLGERQDPITEPPPAADADSSADRRVVFDPGRAADAAVFRRGNALWVVFASLDPLDAGTLLGQGNRSLGPGTIMPAGDAVVLRYPSASPDRLLVLKEGTRWVVILSEDPQTLLWPLEVERVPEAGGPRLIVRADGADRVFRVRDPEIGDSLYVTPLPSAGTGFPRQRRFAQVSLLPTAQGIAARPSGEAVALVVAPEGVAVEADGGLMLSEVIDIGEGAPPDLGGARLFDLETWRGDRDDFVALRRAQRLAVVEASPDDLSRTRLDLARFHFANGYAEEALAVLAILERDDTDLVESPPVRALRGAAQAWAGRVEPALADLDDPELSDEPEAALWRGLAAARGNNWSRADQEFQRARELVGDYPSPFRDELALLIAEAALRHGDPQEAALALDTAASGQGGVESAAPAAAYLRGEIARASGDPQTAATALARAAAGNDDKYRTLAEMALVEIALSEGEITAEEAIDRLDGLRFTWRGDALEFRLLRRLGDLLWDDAQYRDGLITWGRAVDRFPELMEAESLAETRRTRFAQLLASDQADSLSPLTAVSLFEEFRELAPDGVIGDQMIENLAERMVEIDLLDRAADLLQELADTRLDGENRARVATRIAGIRLLDGDARTALAALEGSRGLAMDPDLRFERRLLRARALSELGEPEAALALLSDDTSDLALSAKLDIAWSWGDWATIASTLSTMIEPPRLGESIGPEKAELVVDYAIALAMADDRSGLDRLAIAYGPAMSLLPQANVFSVLTRAEGVTEPIADLATARRQISEISEFERFLAGYREGTTPTATATN